MHSSPADGVLWFAVFIFSTVCHEAAHAWSALRLGDDTASRGGQVSLNPIPHIRREPVGMVVMPLLSWFLGGWMIGWASAPFDPEWARRFPRRAALMALAGPAANLALILAAALLMRLGVEWHVFTAPFTLATSRVVTAIDAGLWELVGQLLSVVFSLNLILFVFNLLPVPPLDGSSLPLLLLPESAARRYFEFTRAPLLRIIGFVAVARGFGEFFPTVFRFCAALLHPGVHYR